MRMRPGKPLPPVSTLIPSASRNKDEKQKRKRKREKAKLVRARRKTIDPTKRNSQHLKGAFLDSIVVADDDDNLPVTRHSKSATMRDQEAAGLSSVEEEGDRSGSSEPESTIEGSPTITKVTIRPLQATVDTDHDFNQEKFRALSLLDSMFGGLEGDQEWGGKEVLDSDVDMPEMPSVQTPLSPQPAPSKMVLKELDVELTVEESQEDSESEESSNGASTPAPERVPTSATTQNANATKARLKDLFAPQEERGASPPADYLS